MSDLKKHIKILKAGGGVVTPKLMGWLSNNDGVHAPTFEIMEKAVDILTPHDGDRSGHFHPSQLYQCKRKQLFEFYGLPGKVSYNPTLQNLFNDGHFRHLRWQLMLLSAGLLTDVEVPAKMPEFRLGGSMDGVNDKEGWVFELKGTSNFAGVQRSGVMAAHKKQTQAYLLASGYEKCVVIYECKSSQQWAEFEVERDDEIAAEITAILTELNHAIDSGEMPEVLDDCKNQTGATFARCPYASSCLSISSTDEIATSVSIG